MAPTRRAAAALGWLVIALVEGPMRLGADGLSNYGAFGKWTLTSSSAAAAEECLGFAVRYLNVIPILRNESKHDYMLVGPTGCEDVVRKWGAERFLIGDNQYHWVYDRHEATQPATNLTIEELHRFMTAINSDLQDDWNEWMDYHYGSYTKSLDPYLKMISAGGLPYKLIAGRTEQLHRADETSDASDSYIDGGAGAAPTDVKGADGSDSSSAGLGTRVYSLFITSPDGNVLELLSTHVSEEHRDMFTYDSCHFRPVKNFDQLNLTDFGFESYDVSKLGSYAIAGAPEYTRLAEVRRKTERGPGDLATTPSCLTSRRRACFVVAVVVLLMGRVPSSPRHDAAPHVAPRRLKGTRVELLAKLTCECWTISHHLSTPSVLLSAQSVPHHTSIASLDPDADVSYLEWLLGARAMNSSDLPNSNLCNGEQARWVHFAAMGAKARSNDHYVKFVKNPNTKRYSNLTVDRYIKTLKRENEGLGQNVYSQFADDHLGFDLPSADFSLVAKKLVEAKVPFLTRREPDPSAPEFWEIFGWEKFSIFVELPGSHWLIQLQTCCVAESFFDLPFTFCDWDFCEFDNYRNSSTKLLSDPTRCGYSAMNTTHPYNELLNESRSEDLVASDVVDDGQLNMTEIFPSDSGERNASAAATATDHPMAATMAAKTTTAGASAPALATRSDADRADRSAVIAHSSSSSLVGTGAVALVAVAALIALFAGHTWRQRRGDGYAELSSTPVE